MTDDPVPRDDPSSMEARLALRKAAREADREADRLLDRLTSVEVDQREARYLLQRAGMLTRRARRDGDAP
ncbi:MAG: hypothetical protein V7607_5511 [Solirubrobacteraceae bacterium]